MYHEVHHGGRLLFNGFCDFCVMSGKMQRKCQREPTRTPTTKNDEKRGIFGTRDADRRKAVFRCFEL